MKKMLSKLLVMVLCGVMFMSMTAFASESDVNSAERNELIPMSTSSTICDEFRINTCYEEIAFEVPSTGTYTVVVTSRALSNECGGVTVEVVADGPKWALDTSASATSNTSWKVNLTKGTWACRLTGSGKGLYAWNVYVYK